MSNAHNIVQLVSEFNEFQLIKAFQIITRCHPDLNYASNYNGVYIKFDQICNKCCEAIKQLEKIKDTKKIEETRQHELDKYKNTIEEPHPMLDHKMNLDLRMNESSKLILQALSFIKKRNQTDAPDVNYRPKKLPKLSEKTTLGKIDKILRQRKPKIDSNFKPTKKTEEAVEYSYPEETDEVDGGDDDDYDEPEEGNDYEEPENAENENEDNEDNEDDDEPTPSKNDDLDELNENDNEPNDDDSNDESDHEDEDTMSAIHDILKQKLKKPLQTSQEPIESPVIPKSSIQIPNYREEYF